MIHKFLTLLHKPKTEKVYDIYTSSFDDHERSVNDQMSDMYEFHALIEYPVKIFGLKYGPAWVLRGVDDPELGPVDKTAPPIVISIPLDYLCVNINTLPNHPKTRKNNDWYRQKGWKSLVDETM